MNPNWEIKADCTYRCTEADNSEYNVVVNGRRLTEVHFDDAMDAISDALIDHGEFPPDALTIANEILADAYHAH